MAILICNVSIAQPPADTARTVIRGKMEIYQNSTGKTIGRSVPNVSGGRTYTNNKGVYSRGNLTYNGGTKFTPSFTNKPAVSYGHFGKGK